VGKGAGVYRVLVRKPEGKSPLEDPGLSGRVISRWKWGGWEWTGLIWLRIWAGDGNFESDDKPFGFQKNQGIC
jgi:hypothetical protein